VRCRSTTPSRGPLPVVPTGGGVVSGHATRGLAALIFHHVGLIARDTGNHEELDQAAVTVLLGDPLLHVHGDMAVVADPPEDLQDVIALLTPVERAPLEAPKVGLHLADHFDIGLHLGLFDLDLGLEDRDPITEHAIKGLHLHRGGGLDDLLAAAAAHGGAFPLPGLAALVLPGIGAAHRPSLLVIRADPLVVAALGVEVEVALFAGEAREEPVLLARETRTLPAGANHPIRIADRVAPVHPSVLIHEDLPVGGPVLDHSGTRHPLTLEGELELVALETLVPIGPFPVLVYRPAGDVLLVLPIGATMVAVAIVADRLHLGIHARVLEGIVDRLLLLHPPHHPADPFLAARLVGQHEQTAPLIHIVVVVANVPLIKEPIPTEGVATDVIIVVVAGPHPAVVIFGKVIVVIEEADIAEGLDHRLLLFGTHADRTGVEVGLDEHLDFGGDGLGDRAHFFLLLVVVVVGGGVVGVLDALVLVLLVKREEILVEGVLFRDLVDRDELILDRAAGATADRAFSKRVTFHDAEVLVRELGDIRAAGIPTHGETVAEEEFTDRVAVKHPHDAILLGKKVYECEVVENFYFVSHRHRRVTPLNPAR